MNTTTIIIIVQPSSQHMLHTVSQILFLNIVGDIIAPNKVFYEQNIIVFFLFLHENIYYRY